MEPQPSDSYYPDLYCKQIFLPTCGIRKYCCMLLPPKAHYENNVSFKSCRWRKTANYSSRETKEVKLLNNLIIQPLYKKGQNKNKACSWMLFWFYFLIDLYFICVLLVPKCCTEDVSVGRFPITNGTYWNSILLGMGFSAFARVWFAEKKN